MPRLRDARLGDVSELPSELAQLQPYATMPDPCPPGFPTTVASAPYDRLLRRLIIAHKERQALGLSRLLADRLAVSVHVLLRLVETIERRTR